MLEALFERRVRPDLLVGTSVGAINAAFVASRPRSVHTARELQRVWGGLRRGHVFPVSPVTASLGFIGLRDRSISASSLCRISFVTLRSTGWEMPRRRCTYWLPTFKSAEPPEHPPRAC